MSAELKPCPHCGSKNIIIKTRKTTIVECVECESLVIKVVKDHAIAVWNRRAPAAPVEAPLTAHPEITPIFLLNAALCIEDIYTVPEHKRQAIVDKLGRIAEEMQAARIQSQRESA